MNAAILPLMWSATAGAVERMDAHGFHVAAQDGDPLDLVTVYRPQAFAPLSLSGLALLELAGPGLVMQRQHGDDIDDLELQDGGLAANLNFTAGLHKRVALGLTVPYYLESAGMPWGDTRISLPLGLALPGDGRGGTFAVLPWIDLPTGDEYHYQGDRGTERGAVMAFGGTGEHFQFTMNLGARQSPEIKHRNLRGGPHAITAMGFGVALGETSALRAEATYEPSLYLHETWQDWRNESPGEANASYWRRTKRDLYWIGGIALPFTEGAGAAVRAFAGVGYAYGKVKGPDTDGDGISDKKDQCINEPENKNGYLDRDGCPDALAEAALTVVNDDQRPVPEATVTIHGFQGVTDGEGKVMVPSLFPVEAQVGTVSHDFYSTIEFTVAELDPSVLNERTIHLVFVPGEVKVTAAREDGTPINARVRFVGPAEVATQYLGPDGSAVFELRPGEWRLLISAPEFGTERHELVIEPGQRATADVQVTLRAARAMMDVERREVRILEQVHFEVGADTIKPDSMPLLAQVANVLLDNPHLKVVEVQGHTDSDGDDQSNMVLSQRRVDNVMRTLVSMGVAGDRLDARGYGETQPIASNATAEGRALNRRVQFVITRQEAPPAELAPLPEPPAPPPPKIDSEGL